MRWPASGTRSSRAPGMSAVSRCARSTGIQVSSVRLGKFIELQLPEGNPGEAKAQVEEMCRKLLANTVVENFRVELG